MEKNYKEKIITRFLEEEMKESYLAYAMSVIVSRALPDIRDGLKPVQRRILYGMDGLHLRYNQSYKKSARVVGECFAKDTLVSTTNGLVPIQDIKKGDSVVTQNGVKEVTQLYFMPPKKLLKITLGNGLENTVTSSQKMKVFSENLEYVFKEAKDLKEGDYIVCKPVYPQTSKYKKTGQIEVNENIAYLLGLLMSDGWVENSSRGYHRLGFCSTEKKTLQKIQQILKKEFDLCENILKKPEIYYLRINKTQINQMLINAFCLQGLAAKNKFIPQEILRSSAGVQYSFLAGLIDGDGSIHKNRQILNYSSVSKKLISQLQAMLFNLGITAIQYSQKMKFHKLNGRQIRSNHPSLSLEISGNNLKKLAKNLCLISSKKETIGAKDFVRTIPSKYEVMPFIGKKVFQEFKNKHLGGGWYYNEKESKKFRLGIKYKNGTKIRYSKDLIDKVKLYKTNVGDINILEKSRLLDSRYYSLIREILEENICFIPVKEITKAGIEKTFDIEVKDDHEFIANGMVSHNCLGKYHPHGDSSVYDALVRMAQDFSLRYPLVDGQGNFGSIDGDPAAAMRYSECRMAKASDYILQDIEKKTVNFFPNFDNSLQEPEVLPSVFPNLICNGASGIAVGMSTNIPPHNLGEVCDALIYLVDNPDASVKKLHKYIKGPDFPTGGIICGKTDILEMYKKGRGKLTVRARASIEKEKNREYIVITEIPYQLNKTTLLEQIANIINKGKVEGVSDLRDESDRDGIRVVIELKRGAQAEIILNQLYKHTSMETTFGAIFLALVNRTPQMLSLKDMLAHHIAFRREVIVRRTKFLLEKAEKRAHILEGLKIALNNLDKIIKIIKKSKDPAAAEKTLIKEFKLTHLQAQAILQMQLQRLCALERKKIDQEYEELLKTIESLNNILSSQKQQEKLIKDEVKEIKEKFADPRRTDIVAEKEEIEVEDLIVEEDMVIAISRLGYIKRMPITTYRHQKRGGRGVTAMATGDTDFVQHLFVASSKDTLLIFTNEGKAYPLKTYEVPQGSRTSKGRAIVNVLKLENNVQTTAVLSVKEFDSKSFILMATQKGMVKRCSLELFAHARKSGIIAISLKKEDELIGVQLLTEKDDVVLATKKGLSIRFAAKQARATGRQSQGVRGIKLAKSDIVLGMGVVEPSLKDDDLFLLTATEKGFAKRTQIKEYRSQTRGGKGIINIKLSSKLGEVKGILLVRSEDQVMYITQKGILIRTKVGDIRMSGRSTQGVKVINLGKQDKLAAIAHVVPGS